MQSCDHGIEATFNETLPSGWIHVVTTFHPHHQSQIQIFINGVEKSSVITESYRVVNTESAILVAGRNNTPGLRDRIEFGLSNVKIFNRKLDKDEVKKLHTADTNRKCLN